jgi:glycine hydroxymethyltransferase
MFESLKIADPKIAAFILQEEKRQQQHIELIASENSVSPAILDALGTVLTNKYAEGYPGKRYYGGCYVVDDVERLAQNRVQELFGCSFSNVQPHSGSQANQATFLAFLNPGDTFLALSLNAGGHLTHGSSVNLSGKWFHAVHYGVSPEDGLIDLAEVEALAHKHRPKMIITGASAYPRFIDFEGFRRIADAVGALFLVDMAHIAGLVAAGVHPSPFPHAHVVTSTTHKTLRGPRGGLILWNDASLSPKINSALFPGLQGGPLLNVIAAKAVCFHEALQPSFQKYGRQVVTNADVLGKTLQNLGFQLVSGGTDNHLVLLDLRHHNLTGKKAESLLEQVGLVVNKNSIPFDPLPPRETSGIRLGTPAGTTRGFGEKEFQKIGEWIGRILRSDETSQEAVLKEIKESVSALCELYPLDFVGH